MAAPILQVLEDGENYYTVHVTLPASAAAVEPLIDVSTLSPNTRFGVPTKLRLDEISYDTDAVFALEWEATTPVRFMDLVVGQDKRDYRKAGGINNNAGVGVNGDVNIPLPAAAVTGTMTLYFTKKFA